MPTKVLWDPVDNVAALYDYESGRAFGDVFTGDDSYEDAEGFLEFLERKDLDAQSVQPNTLADLRREFAEQS